MTSQVGHGLMYKNWIPKYLVNLGGQLPMRCPGRVPLQVPTPTQSPLGAAIPPTSSTRRVPEWYSHKVDLVSAVKVSGGGRRESPND
ncbi:hypothetical protein Hamer_G002335 [Homarus americanus]|uniref:Uncharacterized protein n=1 Tax=Homarus americanus TaxID=6706 RepID=A0A8J5K853_HOMAM|nr:hypothetical protein Hamer_G002335 [Homarus americanus]